MKIFSRRRPPSVRTVPVPRDQFEQWMHPLRSNRFGSDTVHAEEVWKTVEERLRVSNEVESLRIEKQSVLNACVEELRAEVGFEGFLRREFPAYDTAYILSGIRDRPIAYHHSSSPISYSPRITKALGQHLNARSIKAFSNQIQFRGRLGMDNPAIYVTKNEVYVETGRQIWMGRHQPSITVSEAIDRLTVDQLIQAWQPVLQAIRSSSSFPV